MARENEQIRERLRVTRRDVLRIGTAIFSGKTLAGQGAGSSNATDSSRTDAVTSAHDHEAKRYTGYVFHPEYGTYHESIPFQIFIRYPESEASIGRGPDVCWKPRRAYVPYEIRYQLPERPTAFLAVPLLNRQDHLPHEYHVPRTRFRFVETMGTYTFHGDCEESRTPVQHGVFTRVV